MTVSHARGGPIRGGSRGQASVLGVVLVVGITVLGVTGILIFGGASLSASQTQAEIDSAENAMTQLDSRFSTVALSSERPNSARVPLGSGESLTVDESSGWMNVSVHNRTDDDLIVEVFNETLGAIVYENDGVTVAYQGGGVWRQGRSGGSVMISAPEFHYRDVKGSDPTLTLPVVVVRGSGSLSDRPRVTKNASIGKYPTVGNPDRSNPLQKGKIDVTVHSEYYRAWGSFFEDRTGGTISYDHDRKTVTVTLLTASEAVGVEGGIVSTSPGYVLEFGQDALIDSYNSTVAAYDPDNPQENSSVVAAGDISLGQGAEIQGNVLTGGTLLFAGGSKQLVTGDLTYGTDPPTDPDKIQGTIQDGADVAAPSEVGWLITLRGETLDDPADNSNSAESDDITGRTLHCDGDCTLSTGSYYLDSLTLEKDETLTLNASTDDVEIYVDGDVTIDKQTSIIDVNGDHSARLFVNGDFTLEKGEILTTDKQRASAMWVYMRPSGEADFDDAHFEGVIYGPGSGANPGVRIKVQSGNQIWGGLVGYIPDKGSDGIGQNDQVHFDEALTSVDPLSPYDEDAPAVTFLHVSVNSVNVSSG